MEGEPQRAALAAEYPAWQIGRRGPLLLARNPETVPPVELADATVDGLRQRLAEFYRVADRSTLGQALAAARRLQT